MSKTAEQQTLLDGKDLLVQPTDAEPQWEVHDAGHSTSLPAVPAGVPALTPLDLIVRAQDANASPEVLEKYLALYERWREGEAKRAYNNAIAAAQAEIPVIGKNREVDFQTQKGRTNYRYEDLAGVERIVKPVMTKHGLSYRWRTKIENAAILVTCIVSHRDGHSEENMLVGPADTSGNKNPIQAIGSTQTYLQRYTLKAALGLATSEDTDGRVEHENPEHDESAPRTAPRGQRDTPQSIQEEVVKLFNEWVVGQEFASQQDARNEFKTFVLRTTGRMFNVNSSTDWDREALNQCWEAIQGTPGEEAPY